MKLDLGCGKVKKDGFIGVDTKQFPGVDVVCNVGKDVWPWGESTVDEVYSSHMLEHLSMPERCHFSNELCRVLKKGSKAQIITPHWASHRAYGDPTHIMPPVSEMFWWYLNKAWRDENAPHLGDMLTCDFDATQPGYTMHPLLHVRSQEFREHALTFYKAAADDMICTLIKR